jgi:uncharacterized OsmC-like protein
MLLAHKELHVTSVSEGYTTTITAGHHMYYLDEPEKLGGHDLGPNPLQALLGALIGCETITAVAVAKEMKIDLYQLSFSVTGEIRPSELFLARLKLKCPLSQMPHKKTSMPFNKKQNVVVRSIIF